MLFYRLLIFTLIPVREVSTFFQSLNDDLLMCTNNIK